MIWAVSLLTTDLITRRLTPRHHLLGIRSLIEFGKLCDPLAHSVLYLHISSVKASPKAISRRTSYLRARLEFLRYPQVIPALFSGRLVRSSMVFYHHFNLPMDRSPGFGSIAYNLRAIHTRFPFGFGTEFLNLLYTITRRTILQKVPHRALTLFVCL